MDKPHPESLCTRIFEFSWIHGPGSIFAPFKHLSVMLKIVTVNLMNNEILDLKKYCILLIFVCFQYFFEA